MATDGFRPFPSYYDRCFGCGRDHPTGLHLEMWGLDDELRVRGSFTVTEHHQGAPGLAHGGVISAAVDEGMGYLLWLVGSPAGAGRVAGGASRRVDRREGRKIWASMQGRVDDDVAVEAEALYVMVGLEHFRPARRADGRADGGAALQPLGQDPKPKSLAFLAFRASARAGRSGSSARSGR